MSTAAAFRTMKERHRYDGAIIYHEQHQNKEDRIATLEPAIANGWLAFNERDLPGEFWKQFRQFPTADHNDAPDAVQGAQVPDNHNRPTPSESRGCTQATKAYGAPLMPRNGTEPLYQTLLNADRLKPDSTFISWSGHAHQLKDKRTVVDKVLPPTMKVAQKSVRGAVTANRAQDLRSSTGR